MANNTAVINPAALGAVGDTIRTIEHPNGSVKTQTTIHGGFKSSANSTTTPLGSGGTFTGTAETNDASDLLVSCKADQDGTLYVDFSNDGGSSYPSTLTFPVTANSHEFHCLLKGPRTYRVRYVNGSVAQGSLDLSVYCGTFRQPNSALNSTIGADADAQVVRAVSTELDLALGRFGGMTEDTKFGFVTGIDAADNPVDVWAFANDALATRSDTKTFPTSAATLYAASDSNADTSKTFTATYLQSDGTEASVNWTTDASDGRTAVSLGVSGLDVSRVFISGDNQTHAGNIYVQQGSGFTAGVPNSVSAVLAFIPAGFGQTEQCSFTVPTDKTRRLKYAIFSLARANGAAGSAEIHLRTKSPGGSWRVRRVWHVQSGFYTKTMAGLVLSGGTQCVMRLHDVSDADSNVTAELAFDDVSA